MNPIYQVDFSTPEELAEAVKIANAMTIEVESYETILMIGSYDFGRIFPQWSGNKIHPLRISLNNYPEAR